MSTTNDTQGKLTGILFYFDLIFYDTLCNIIIGGYCMTAVWHHEG